MITLRLLKETFCVCKVDSFARIDLEMPYLFLAGTPDERSVVCPVECAPRSATAVEPGWRALCVTGTLDFGLVGILAGLSGALAAEGISLFAISTYDTDYLLVKAENLARGLEALKAAGYAVEHGDRM